MRGAARPPKRRSTDVRHDALRTERRGAECVRMVPESCTELAKAWLLRAERSVCEAQEQEP